MQMRDFLVIAAMLCGSSAYAECSAAFPGHLQVDIEGVKYPLIDASDVHSGVRFTAEQRFSGDTAYAIAIFQFIDEVAGPWYCATALPINTVVPEVPATGNPKIIDFAAGS